MMKKHRSGIAAGTALVAMLAAACGSSGSSSASGATTPTTSSGGSSSSTTASSSSAPSTTTTTISSGAYHGGVKISYATFGSTAGMQSVVTSFNRKYSGKYYATVTAVPYAQYAALLSADLSAHKAPDMFSGSYTPGVYYSRLGLTYPIAPFLKTAGINPTTDFPRSEWNPALQVNGTYYSAPVAAFGTALFWNKTLFKKAGLNPNKPPTTGAQVISDAQALKKAGVKYPIIQGTGKGTNDFEYPSLVYQFGGKMGQGTTCKALFNSTAGKQALTWEKNLIYKYKVSPAGASTNEDLTQFAAGTEGMAILPAINAGSFITQLGKAKFGVDPLPKIGSNSSDFLGQNYVWVFKQPGMTAAKKKAIGLFLGAMYRHDSVALATQGGVVPSYLPALSSSAVKNGPYFSAQYAMVKTGVLNPPIPNWGTVTAVPLYDYVQNALLNRQSVTAALAEAQTKTNQLTKTLPGCTQ